MFSTFWTGYSGLQINATGLNVISNNLSNINTVGFKRGQANFEQLMTNMAQGATGTGAPIQFGLGARTSEIVNYFDQGNFINTGLSTNLALEGRGFFMLAQGTDTVYTRAGNFMLDEDGFLTSPSGANVQGYTELNPDGTINTNGAIGNVQVDPTIRSPAEATSLVRFVTNLSGAAEPGEEFISTINVFDSNGESHSLNLLFTKTDTPGEWDYQFVFENGTVSTTQPTQGNGTILFGENGTLAEIDGVPIAQATDRTVVLSDLPDGAADISFTFDMIDDTGAGYMTNLGPRSNTGGVFQNGSSSGELQRVEFDRTGTMFGFYNNGDTVPLARLATATFTNNQGLRQGSSGFFSQTSVSGEAQVAPAGRALVLSGVLETSNVDIADEFTSLIVHQRGYQSNSKSITTADQVLQEVINLKR
ncbi:MAG: flagellar hook-basal body complex protein [Acidobacteriota bacterium]|nr:flagellar hook-basal body complex protein [Acidobacteriota bacterium]